MIDRVPVIIDCDPGIDDAFALALAASYPGFDLRALTTVGGNLELDVTYRNARDIAACLQMDVRIGKGAESPLIRNAETAAHAHGKTGLGYTKLPKSQAIEDKTLAWDMIHEEALKNPGETVLVALGPLTNVALALVKYPDLKYLLKEIRIMGGSAASGNHSAYGEFNIWADPHAAQLVFESGIPIYLFGLHLTTQGALSRDDLEIISKRTGLGRLFDGFIEFLFDPEMPYYRKDGAILHDAITVASLLKNSLMTFRSAYLCCELASEMNFGRTVMEFRQGPGTEFNAEIAMTIDRDEFCRMMQDMGKEKQAPWRV